MRKIAEIYRSKLRNHLKGIDGEEAVRARVEEYANQTRPIEFLVRLTANHSGIN
jgi:maintenance of morphology protein 1